MSKPQKSKSLYLIDGHYQIYRSFYAAPQRLATAAGEPTGAIHVFCQMLFSLMRQRKPDYLAVCMDVSDRTVFRVDLDPEYKANRDSPPESLTTQADHIVDLVGRLGIPIYRQEGFEADDLMATIAAILADESIDVYLVSRDKDLEQLIGPSVRMFDPAKGIVIDEAWLADEKGYTPQQALEIQSLTGDSTDNVPGIPGVGPKTALKLIKKYGTAASVLEHADELTPKMKANVLAFGEKLPVTRKLVELRNDVPFDFELASCATGNLDVEAAAPLLSSLELNRLSEMAKEFQAGDAESSGAKGDAAESDGANPARTATGSESAPEQAPAIEAEYVCVDTPDAFKSFLAALRKESTIAFDTETTGVNPVAADLVGISFCWKAGHAYYIPVRGMIGKTLPVDDVIDGIRDVMENPAVRKVGHHIKYDMLVMRKVGIEVRGIWFDTMIGGFLTDPLRPSFSMDNMVKGLLGHEMIPISDLIGKGRKQITIDQVDIRHVSHYASEDADFTWRLMEYLVPLVEDGHVARLFEETEMPLVSVLADMEFNGVAIDRDLLTDLGKSMAQRMEVLEKDVHKAAGHEFNLASTKQLAAVLFDEQGLKPIRKTKTGRSTDAETLQALAAQGECDIPRLILEYREVSKLKSTYVDTLPRMVCEETGRIHASFHQTGAVTGRLSSSDPNLQNIPIRTEMGRQIRAAFVAQAPGDVLLVADYSQIELRLLAHFCQDAALMEAFQSGQDIHRTVAAHVNGVALEDVTSEQRSAAKAVNFGIIYGQTAFGLARALDIPVAEAKSFIDMYFMRYPGIRLFIDECVEKAKHIGFAETILGRRRPIPELHSRNRQQVGFGERISVNTVVQGSAADLIKRAMIDIHAELRTGGYAARMITQVHDELVFELPESKAAEEAVVVRRLMESAIPLSVPLVVDLAWGTNWAAGK